jgi:hypothetical protein
LEARKPDDMAFRVATREAIEQQAAVLEKQGQRAEALKLVKANIPIFEQAVRANPNNLRFQRLLAESRRHVAALAAR